ncbi:MAG TPA: zinc ribbon domain-containing protein [bacterium]
MLTVIIFLLLTAAVSYFVVSPIMQSRRENLMKDSNHKANDLIDRKEAIYAAIKDIEFDYQMGKLSEEDFQMLRQQYKDEAVGLLKKIDQIQHKAVKSKDKSAPRKKADAASPRFCWSCGEAVTHGDKFCVNCGNTLESQSS